MNQASDIQDDQSSDLARLLPWEVFAEVILMLRGSLPPPVTDDPAAWARRDRAAMAAVASLLPVNGVEARLAAQFVAVDAFAAQSMRTAHELRLDPVAQARYARQAMGMIREGKGVLRLLLKLQANRQAVAADETAATCAAWVEHGALGMMQAALSAREAALAEAAPGAAAPEAAAPEDAGVLPDAAGEEVQRDEAVSPAAKPLRESRAETAVRFPLAATSPG
jgi:hypothetical protein